VVRLPASTAARYRRFSLYNSPYPAHECGRAVDLYPDPDANVAPAPVPGVVRETRAVRAPSRPYAAARDHLLVVEVDDGWAREHAPGVDGGLVARLLHVDPGVAPGDRVEVGESLGRMVRSGFFGRWVANHLHLGFRRADQDAHRAGGSLPLSTGVAVEPVDWDGTGEVVAAGPTHVRLDAPAHPAPGERFVALAAGGGVPLDGGLAHYAGGGALGDATGALSLRGTPVADVAADGRTLRWHDVAVRADGERATGLSLFATRVPFGAKVVFHEGHDFSVGDRIEVTVEPTDDPVRLGLG